MKMRRILSALLCFAMVVAMVPNLPFIAKAADVPTTGLSMGQGIYVPKYSGGTTSNVLEYDCGNGVTDNGEKSYLRIVTKTTKAEFNSYCGKLENAYGTPVFTNATAGQGKQENLFRKYLQGTANGMDKQKFQKMKKTLLKKLWKRI